MKDRTRRTRVPNLQMQNNRRDRRKAKRLLGREYRFHRKDCVQCQGATKVPDRVLTEAEIQAKRCPEGQELYLERLRALETAKTSLTI